MEVIEVELILAQKVVDIVNKGFTVLLFFTFVHGADKALLDGHDGPAEVDHLRALGGGEP